MSGEGGEAGESGGGGGGAQVGGGLPANLLPPPPPPAEVSADGSQPADDEDIIPLQIFVPELVVQVSDLPHRQSMMPVESAMMAS